MVQIIIDLNTNLDKKIREHMYVNDITNKATAIEKLLTELLIE